MNKNLQYIILFAITSILTLNVNAQNIKTSYFMDKSIVRSNMNPALMPQRGYFNIPAIGGIGANFTSNALTVDLLFKKKDGGVVIFLNPTVNAEDFLSKIKTNNAIDIESAVNILGFGFFNKNGKSYWTVDINTKINGGVNLPKSFFEFAKIGSGVDGCVYDLKDIKFNVMGYGEVAIGNARRINEKLTVGVKLKIIAGLGDMNAHIKDMKLNLNSEKWEVYADGRIDATLKGISLDKSSEEGKENQFELDSFDYKFKGISGYGAGIDFGAEYKLLPCLSLSAAVVDLGFICWSKGSTVSGKSVSQYSFDGFSNDGDDEDLLNEFGKLGRFEEVNAKGRTTSLRTTINIGAEYTFCREKLSVGLLSSTQIRRTKAFTELTLSGNWKANKWFTASLSYSMIHSQFKTFGFALDFSPSWIHFFVGTDYMIGKVTKQFIPIKQRNANMYVGLGIPMTKRNNNCF